MSIKIKYQVTKLDKGTGVFEPYSCAVDSYEECVEFIDVWGVSEGDIYKIEKLFKVELQDKEC